MWNEKDPLAGDLHFLQTHKSSKQRSIGARAWILVSSKTGERRLWQKTGSNEWRFVGHYTQEQYFEYHRNMAASLPSGSSPE